MAASVINSIILVGVTLPYCLTTVPAGGGVVALPPIPLLHQGRLRPFAQPFDPFLPGVPVDAGSLLFRTVFVPNTDAVVLPVQAEKSRGQQVVDAALLDEKSPTMNEAVAAENDLIGKQDADGSVLPGNDGASAFRDAASVIGPVRGILPDGLTSGKIASATLFRANADTTVAANLLGYAIFVQRSPLSGTVALVALTLATEVNVADNSLEIRTTAPKYNGNTIQCSSTGSVYNPFGVPGGGVVTSAFTTNGAGTGSYFSDDATNLSRFKLFTNVNSINGKALVLRSPRTGDLACGVILEA